MTRADTSNREGPIGTEAREPPEVGPTVADELGISPDGVRKLIRRGRLRAIRRSAHKILIPRPAFDAYLRKLSGVAADPVSVAEFDAAVPLEDRCHAFAEQTGMSPAAWVAAWKASGDDTAFSMQLAAAAVGLLDEQEQAREAKPAPAPV